MALVGVLFLALTLPALAALTGTISGTVTDAVTKAPVANVTVTAIAPTGRATTKTDSRGFYSLTGLQPDTYTLSFEYPGFQANVINGVTVSAEQSIQENESITKEPKNIARVTARSQGSAFQPNQTTDTYTVTSQQITTTQGKDNNNNLVTLVGSLPGAMTDASGYPSLRGGRENEIGFQFEGINYDEPYSNQFANSLLLNGVGSLQLSPGSGDASQGNSGTGVINLIAKRGTYPAFGMFSVEAASQTFWHDLIAEYGFATPDGRFSNYFKYIGQRQAELYGNHNQNLDQINSYNGNSNNIVNDYVDNLIYKFGKNQNKSFQLFYQGQVVQYGFGAGIPQSGQTFYRTGTPAYLQHIANIYNGSLGTSFTPENIAAIQSFYPGQTSLNQALPGSPGQTQPLQALKIQFNDNPDSASYYNLRFYRLSSVTVFDFPITTPSPGGNNAYQILQGGLRTGGAFDYNRQLNSKNLISVGGQYNFDLPVNSYVDPRTGLYNASGLGELGGFLSGGQGFEALDFLPAANCPATSAGFGSCGYLARYFPNGLPRIPANDTYEPYTRHTYGVYLKDDIQLSDRFRLSTGIRLDGSSYNFGDLAATYGPGISNGTNDAVHPLILQPRVGASYRLTQNDSVSASFGRSIQNPYFSSSVNAVNPAYYNQFKGIPAFDNLTGNQSLGNQILAGTGTVNFCGVGAIRPCKDYADQMFWENQNSAGLPVFTVKPEQFINWDFSYSHQFPAGVALKVTPFYRKGENQIVSTNSILTQTNGVPVLGPTITSNNGVSKTTGLEFLLTKTAAFGFSGQLTATYINELSNVPPLASQEDVFPTIAPASLALGKLYRVGFISPFQGQLSVQYQSHGGLRINPVIQYTRGYPYNQGSLTAFAVPGVGFASVPNTNITSPNGSNVAPCYVDAGNPGTLQHPQIVACRGTAESPDPGGILSNGRFNTNVTVEYQPPRSRILFGVQALGLFNNLYGYPTSNDCYQPVAYGVSGPASGTGVCANSQHPYGNGTNQYVNIRGTSPYLLIPNNYYGFTAQSQQAPLLTLFYMQVKL